jgi:RHS repeat-associated protein
METTSSTGDTSTATVSSVTNYSAPSAVSLNGLSTLMQWNSFLGLTQETGPNSDTTYYGYSSGDPSTVQSPYGAVGTYTYDYTGKSKTFTVGNKWTKTYFDGFGRTAKVEKGYRDQSNGGVMIVVSSADTEYDACACSPVGKVKRTSMPYAPGGTKYWTEYTYDEMGRTLTARAADGASTTTYEYSTSTSGTIGLTVKVTDAAGKWKKMYMDAFGNLLRVDEPNPAGGQFETYYAYDVFNRLRTVTMPRGAVTQTRTWNYDPGTQLLTSQTLPESGTTQFFYDSRRRLDYQVDAKGQKMQLEYDLANRVTVVKRYPSTTDPELSGGRVTRTYDSDSTGYGQNLAGRLATVTYSGGTITEYYSYTPAGNLTKKKLVLTRGFASASLSAELSYDSEGKVSAVKYPNGTTYRNLFDNLGRLSGMQQDNYPYGRGTVDWVKDVVYGPAGELKQITWAAGIGEAPAYDDYRVETRSYNSMLQLTSLTVSPTYPGSSGINVTYNYPAAGANNGRISSMTNAISGETIVYQYDSLNRLSSASTTAGPSWGLSFSYDGFGNRLDQTITQGSAPAMSLMYDGLTNRISTPGYGYDPNGNLTSMPGKTMTYDPANRLLTVSVGMYLAESYGYAPDNKRIYKRKTSGTGYVEEMYFYVGDRKLATAVPDMQIPQGGDTPVLVGFTNMNVHLWFGGKKLAARDRLGSNVTSQKRYFPYGEEATSTANDADKFATYYRDAGSGFDYADQRYYSATVGRFLTPDPYVASGGAGNPASWNRYAYVEGDPVNFNDPIGLYTAVLVHADPSDPWLLDYLQDQGNPRPRPDPNEDNRHPILERKELLNESLARLRKRIDDDCAKAIGAKNSKDAIDRLKMNIGFSNLGGLTGITDASGNLVSVSDKQSLAQYSSRTFGLSKKIQLNSQVNWADPNNTTATDQNGKAVGYRVLDAAAFQLGINSITSAQFMDLIVLHEMAHSFGEDHPTDPTAYNKDIWMNCFK